MITKTCVWKIIFLCIICIDVSTEKILSSRAITKPAMGGPKGHSATKQTITCYENRDLSGSSVKAVDYISDLRNYNFDNRIQSCCVQSGIWILYSDKDYNSGTTAGNSFYMFGDNYCTNVPRQFLRTASSLRFTGAPDGYKFDTLNFYHQINFSGREEYTYNDKDNMVFPDNINSLVLTGCTAWTLYGSSGYRNPIGCVYPADQTNCYPGMYRNLRSLGVQRVGSVRRGCYSPYRLYPQK